MTESWDLGPAGALPAQLEAQAQATPDRIAVVAGASHLSYGLFARRVRRGAATLRAAGVRTEVVVGVCADRSIEHLIGVWAVLQAGGVYLPLDPELPAERLAMMCREARVRIILTQAATAARVGGLAPIEALEAPGQPGPGWRGTCAGTQLAYVLYTSGSTGRPKGAMNAHAGIANRLAWMQDAFPLDAADRVLLKTPHSFDVSLWELWWPLLSGACAVVADPNGHRDAGYLVKAIAREQVTTVHFVPSLLRHFVQKPGVGALVSLRRVIASGEALDAALVRQWAACSRAPLFNLYGPTEAAVDVTWWACDPSESDAPPIGVPIANTTMEACDAQGVRVPDGEAGELYIGGVAVGRGYVGRPDLTAERFLPDAYAARAGMRRYRTGDLGRRRPTGAIDYLGRLDHQVKLRGVRIELGEIETVARECPGIREAVVVVDRAGSDAARLVCYWMAERDRMPASLSTLQSWIQRRLPGYMVPSAWCALDDFPRTASGKIDRRALRLTAPSPAADRLSV